MFSIFTLFILIAFPTTVLTILKKVLSPDERSEIVALVDAVNPTNNDAIEPDYARSKKLADWYNEIIIKSKTNNKVFLTKEENFIISNFIIRGGLKDFKSYDFQSKKTTKKSELSDTNSKIMGKIASLSKTLIKAIILIICSIIILMLTPKTAGLLKVVVFIFITVIFFAVIKKLTGTK